MTLSGWAYEADGSLILTPAIPATANRGLASIGPGPWDGASAGHFAGSASGTALAVNAPGAFAGNLLDIQWGGVSKLSLSANGVLTGLVGVISELEVGFVLGFNSDRNSVVAPLRGQTGQAGDYLQAQDSNVTVLSGIRSDGLIYSTLNGLATKQKAGIPADTDWTVAPPNGTLVVDSTDSKLYVRVGGAWKGVAVA